jgi:acid stress chaperone HdeB
MKSEGAMTMPGRQTLTAIITACAIFAVTSAVPANAQIILDMSLITCKQYLESDAERQELVAAWMSGFFNASRNQPRVDFARFALNKNRVGKYCKGHKPETLMSAIQRSAY